MNLLIYAVVFVNNHGMKKCVKSVNEVKSYLQGLKGKNLTFRINRGRNKSVSCAGEIINTFPSLFTVRYGGGELASFSYSDVICGVVVIAERGVND